MEMRQTRWGNIPARFFCAISDNFMLDPVRDVRGNVYERAVVEKRNMERGSFPVEDLVLDTELKQEIAMFLAHSPQGVNIAIEPNNNVAANVTGQSAGHGPAASPAAASPASPVAPPSEDNTTPAVLETPDHLRGISYNVQVLSWYTVDEYNRRKMDDLDHCIGVEHPSCVSCLNPCGGGLAGSNVPWFFNGKLDCRDTSASVLHDGTNMKAATICVSSLADFKQKSILYEYDDWDEHGVKPEMSLAMAMDFVPGREIRYDWHHASSGHWASWCMEGRFASKEAENAQQKMYNVFDFAKAVGFLGLIALLVKV